MVFDGPVRLDERQFTLREAAFLADIPLPNVRNWIDRDIVKAGTNLAGRASLTLLDIAHLMVLHDLTINVPLGPTLAVQAADRVAGYIEAHSPRDAAGGLLLDLKAINPSAAFAFTCENGELRGDLVHPTRHEGHTFFAGPWGRAHILVPIAAILARVVGRLLEITSTTEPGA